MKAASPCPGEAAFAVSGRDALVRVFAQVGDDQACTAASAPCRCSGRAGSASGARAASMRPAPWPAASPRPRAGSCRGARPVRLATRKMWVSTAMVGSPKAMFSTTLAVLRPTPGSASSASRSRGTSPPCCSIRMLRQRDDVLRLGAEEADGLDVVAQPLLAERHIFAGVSATLEQRRGRLVDADIGRLGRQHHGDQQGEGVDVFELGPRPGWRPRAGEEGRRSRLASCAAA